MYSLLVNDKVQPVVRMLAWLARNVNKPAPTKRLRRTFANACRHATRMAEAQKLVPDLSNEISEAWSRWIEHGSSERWQTEQLDFKRFADFLDELLAADKRVLRIELVNNASNLGIATAGMFNAEIEGALQRVNQEQ